MIYYATGNKDKLNSANRRLAPFGIKLEQAKLKGIVEMQSDDIQEISLSKAKQAFEILKKPLVVNDSGWFITALNGFPGPFMVYMNKWLSAENFLGLMEGKENREVVLKEVVCYIDENDHKFFSHDLKGKVLTEARGNGIVSDTVISLSPSGKSIAEHKTEGIKASDGTSLWEEFGKWYKSQKRLGS